MPPPFDSLRRSVRRHGLWPSLLRSAYSRLRGLVYFEICRVESSSGDPYDWPDVAGYETREVDAAEFHRTLCPELEGRDYQWAFDRGDLCAASTFQGRVVGYSFSTNHPTQVLQGLEFVFPERFVYVFASYTAPSHRGRKLERVRWKVAREACTRRYGHEMPSIWYINVANLESRAANAHAGVRHVPHGYAGFVRLFGRWFTFASPGCRRLGGRFVPSGEG